MTIKSLHTGLEAGWSPGALSCLSPHGKGRLCPQLCRQLCTRALAVPSTVQAHQTPAVRRFWLAVVVENSGPDDADISSTFVSMLTWFLWHFTAAAVPEPLRQRMASAAHKRHEQFARTRTVSNFANTAGALQRSNFSMDALMLMWVLKTDPATADLVQRDEVLDTYMTSKDGMQAMQKHLLNEVCLDPQIC